MDIDNGSWLLLVLLIGDCDPVDPAIVAQAQYWTLSPMTRQIIEPRLGH